MLKLPYVPQLYCGMSGGGGGVCGLNRVYLEAGIRILDREKLPISLLCIQEPASK